MKPPKLDTNDLPISSAINEILIKYSSALAEIERLKELEFRVAKRCKEAVPEWAPELRELLASNKADMPSGKE